MSNWETELKNHFDKARLVEVSVYNKEYMQRNAGEPYPSQSGIIATSDDVLFTVVNRATDVWVEVPASQVEEALVRLNIANSYWVPASRD